MDTTDFSKIRKEFQVLNKMMRDAWESKTPEEYQATWPKIESKREELCMKYFGHDLEIDGEYVNPEMVLDWIEHFLKVDR